MLQKIPKESIAGLVLIFSSILALILANSPLAAWYDALIQSEFYVGLNQWRLGKPILLWINDGLMALFFLQVGLEMKREMIEGQLSNPAQVILPSVAALGGILFPAIIYWLFNHNEAATLKGWAIPTATDIAFALGVLGLLGKRVPLALKLFLLTVAIFDDLAAIIIIATFYTENLSGLSLLLASFAILGLIICNYQKVSALSAYCVLGLLLWFFVLKSGVHATLAGVILAFTIPLNTSPKESSMLKDLEHSLHNWVAYLILPLFAFANAGIHFDYLSVDDLASSLTIGISLGLFLGKQLGIFSFSFLLIKMGKASLPKDTSWLQLYGVAVLGGIGFTMSLFISSLAFQQQAHYIVESRLGIFLGTILSAVIGYIILYWCYSSKNSLTQKQSIKN